ncbi:MAG: hypothetical protein KIT68_09360 [Phycisphaeraceae bacterium]|nr:hypothetical protein [Phycisphaeraceae bacterium]
MASSSAGTSENSMSVTAKILKLFRADQQIRGLRGRLDAAERFLSVQAQQLGEIEKKHGALSAMLKQLKATVAGDEGEAKRIDARIDALREQMNAARTNKEYTAFLNELNLLKAQKDEIEKNELASMEKVEAVEKQVAEVQGQKAEREKIVAQARADRDARAAEIKDRLDELTGQRSELVKDVPAEQLRIYDELVRRLGDQAVSNVEVLDRRNHEWTCGSCQMALPVEKINGISAGRFTRCSACGCILFTEVDVVAKTVKTPREPKAKKQAAGQS